MPDARCCVLLAPSVSLCDDLRFLLDSEGGQVISISAGDLPTSVEASGEDAIASLLPEDAAILIVGSSIFPESRDDDRNIREGLLRSFLAIKAVTRGMIRRRFGRIIVVAPSPSESRPSPQAIKESLMGLAKSVAREVGTRGITANVVGPGHEQDDERDLSPYVALARRSRPQDVVGAVRFLISDDAGYITGQFLRVDGGLSTA